MYINIYIRRNKNKNTTNNVYHSTVNDDKMDATEALDLMQQENMLKTIGS